MTNSKQKKNEHILLDYTATDYAQNNFSLTETRINLLSIHASFLYRLCTHSNQHEIKIIWSRRRGSSPAAVGCDGGHQQEQHHDH
jgi:hypothetical protein